jgi:hypothetical protein
MTSHRDAISSRGPSGNTQELPLSLIDLAIGRMRSSGCGGVGVGRWRLGMRYWRTVRAAAGRAIWIKVHNSY